MEAAAAMNERRRRTKGGASRNRAAAEKKIPAFGDWDFVHEDNVPITQYFECCARHPYSPTLPTPCPVYYSASNGYFNAAGDLFPPGYDDFHGLYYPGPHHQQQQSYLHFCQPPPLNMRSGGGGGRQVVKGECGTQRRRRRLRRSCLENRNRVFDVTVTEETLTAPVATESSYDVVSATTLTDLDRCHGIKTKSDDSKAKDEDLYKIPPELLRRNSKPKKTMSKFFSKCFVTICASH